MRILGIDCGGEYTGYGVVEQDDEDSLHHLCSGAIRLLPREPLELRLKKICEKLTEIIATYTPEQVAIEDVFYAVNVKSALKLGHVRGVAMLVAAQAGLEVVAYSPLSIKSAVVGYGKAEKSPGADDGRPPARFACASRAAGRGRRAGHRHLPLAHCGHPAAATRNHRLNPRPRVRAGSSRAKIR